MDASVIIAGIVVAALLILGLGGALGFVLVKKKSGPPQDKVERPTCPPTHPFLGRHLDNPNHGDVCRKKKGDRSWACPPGCNKLAGAPWCATTTTLRVVDGETTSEPCRVRTAKFSLVPLRWFAERSKAFDALGQVSNKMEKIIEFIPDIETQFADVDAFNLKWWRDDERDATTIEKEEWIGDIIRKINAIEGKLRQVKDMERRITILHALEPQLEDTIETIQVAVNVRGMGDEE